MSTVMLCGSLGSTAAMWEPQQPVLEDHRTIMLEHPGHGAAPLVEVDGVQGLAARALATIGDERFSFVGLSLGGAIGMQLALEVPERIEKLVLACTSARFGDQQQWLDRAAVVRSEGLGAIVDAVLARWFTTPVEQRWREMFLSVDAEGYARCCEAVAGWDARETIGAITVPTLVVAAAEDPSTPPDQLVALAETIPGARLELIEGAAHLANVERPDEFNRLLEGWL
ncbi:MAG: alpha/beta fold hydrolase [Thermoleophilia bacterium]|nr:alpha/beta fold hydrolase [Thermoleophilia bacterium]